MVMPKLYEIKCWRSEKKVLLINKISHSYTKKWRWFCFRTATLTTTKKNSCSQFLNIETQRWVLYLYTLVLSFLPCGHQKVRTQRLLYSIYAKQNNTKKYRLNRTNEERKKLHSPSSYTQISRVLTYIYMFVYPHWTLFYVHIIFKDVVRITFFVFVFIFIVELPFCLPVEFPCSHLLFLSYNVFFVSFGSLSPLCMEWYGFIVVFLVHTLFFKLRWRLQHNQTKNQKNANSFNVAFLFFFVSFLAPAKRRWLIFRFLHVFVLLLLLLPRFFCCCW